MELRLHGVDQDRCGAWFGVCGCRCCDVADGGYRYDCQTGETYAGNCCFLSLHGNWNSFRLQNTPAAECIGSAADLGDSGRRGTAFVAEADDWTGESGLS